MQRQDSHLPHTPSCETQSQPKKLLKIDNITFLFFLEDVISLGPFSLIDCPNIISVITDELI